MSFKVDAANAADLSAERLVNGTKGVAATSGLLQRSLPVAFLVLAAVVGVVVAALVIAGVPGLTSRLIVMVVVVLGVSLIAAETC